MEVKTVTIYYAHFSCFHEHINVLLKYWTLFINCKVTFIATKSYRNGVSKTFKMRVETDIVRARQQREEKVRTMQLICIY